ncbi:exported hypothetical protein [Agrobacterium fabacearum TT111]|nr:exported hypothetical protein [Agrobacterium fabacearum TT111]
MKRRGFLWKPCCFRFCGLYVAAAKAGAALLWRSVAALDMMAVESILIQGKPHVSFGLRRLQDRYRSFQLAYDGADDGGEPLSCADPR